MKVFYSPRMMAPSYSFSPSPEKPGGAVQSWLDLGFDIEIVEPVPVSREQLCRAHDSSYVDDVLSFRKKNGFGNFSKKVAASLPYTSGAMLDAARKAVWSGSNTCAPVSGFHHAGFSSGHGFCTFNGLMVTALDLLAERDVNRVGILDCDHHYGDGTDNILNRVLNGDQIEHYSAGETPRTNKDAERFLSRLSDLIFDTYRDCEVLLYQAGADPHINDPMGGWLTTEQLQLRDRIVFQTAKKMNLPICWNLAGGYQRDADGSIRPVLDIHDNTMRECLAVG